MPPVEYDHIVFPERGGVQRSGDRIHNHLMGGAADETLLQNSVTMTTTATLNPAARKVTVDVSITNDKTGHHIPTDAPIRQMILVVQAEDESGRPLAQSSGPSLPEWTGNYSGEPGRAYAKILRDEWTDETPTAAYWRPVTVVSDTRLPALATDRSRYTFDLPVGSRAARVEARLIFRRAFQKLAEQKGWNDPDIVMERASLTVK